MQDLTNIHTLKKQLENEENRYKTLAENSPVGVCIVRGYKIIYANKTLLNIVGYHSERELINVNPLNLIHQKDKNAIIEVFNTINSGKASYPIKMRISNVRADGSYGILDLLITDCLIYNQIYTQAIVIDMTKDLEAEKKNKQIAADSLYINQKNKILHEIETELNNVLAGKKTFQKKDFQHILDIIGSYGKLDRDWSLLKSHFEEIHSNFFNNLKKAHPLLTINDLKHCACIKLNFSTKEIARFFNVKATSVQISRVRLKKKMELEESSDLRNYILTF
jgi:PAS domain S-box-containing protein